MSDKNNGSLSPGDTEELAKQDAGAGSSSSLSTLVPTNRPDAGTGRLASIYYIPPP
jgi:hypothetical protein